MTLTQPDHTLATDQTSERAATAQAVDPMLQLLQRMTDPELLMTTDEVADYLRVPLSTVYYWREKKTGPRGLTVGRCVRFRAGDVRDWLEAQ